jgi:hypothetical protein
MIRSPWLEIIIGATLAVLGCVVAMILADPVRAQDYPACIDADEFVANLVVDGAREGPVVEYETSHADKLRLVEFQGILWVLMTNHGCLMAKPLGLDYVKDRGEPA